MRIYHIEPTRFYQLGEGAQAPPLFAEFVGQDLAS